MELEIINKLIKLIINVFLRFLLNKKTKNNPNIYSMTGILLPEKIIPENRMHITMIIAALLM